MAKRQSGDTIHLIKLAVGVDDVAHLAALQARRLFDFEGQPATLAWTRRKPTRDAVLNGGSIYWIIKGRVQARQSLRGFVMERDDADGREYCCLVLDPALMRTAGVPHRAFQGWRYLAPAKAPPDIGRYVADESEGELSPEMESELRALGLL